MRGVAKTLLRCAVGARRLWVGSRFQLAVLRCGWLVGAVPAAARALWRLLHIDWRAVRRHSRADSVRASWRRQHTAGAAQLEWRRLVAAGAALLLLLGVATLGSGAGSSSGTASAAAASAAADPGDAERQTPAAVRRRQVSRSAYRGLGRADALALARAKHDVGLPAWKPVDLLGGRLRITGWKDDHNVRLDWTDEPDRPRLLVTSNLPLRTPAASGDKEPVDLSLQPSADGFVPANPLVPARLGDHADHALRLPRAGVDLSSAAGGDTAGELAGGTVFYANTDDDTDFMVMPMALGAEASWQLRSPASPEALALRVGMPDGAVLRPRRDGAAEVVHGQTPLAEIHPPTAWDATGYPVDVETSVVGDEVHYHVAHRDHDVEYPLLVDPWIEDEIVSHAWDANGQVPSPDPFRNWTTRLAPAGGTWPLTFTKNDVSDSTRDGIYVQSTADLPSGIPNPLDAVWAWALPSTSTAWIFKAQFQAVSHTPSTTAGANPCLSYGLTTGPSGDWDTSAPNDANPPSSVYPAVSAKCSTLANQTYTVCEDGFCSYNRDTQTFPAAPHPRGNSIQFGERTRGAWAGRFTTYAGGVTVYLADDDNPTVSIEQVPTGWTNDPNALLRIRGRDNGLGVDTLSMDVTPAVPSWSGRPTTYDANGCLPSCDTSVPLNGTVGNLPTGTYQLTGSATDVGGGHGATLSPATLKIDKTPPHVDPDVFISANDTGFVADAGQSFGAFADDGNAGIYDVAIKLDGVTRASTTATDPTSSPHVNYSLAALNETEGKHQLSYVAHDLAGPTANTGTVDYPVYIDHTKPDVTLSGSLYDARNISISSGSYGLHVDAKDGSNATDAQIRSGVASVDIRENNNSVLSTSQSCAARSCDLQRDWTFDTSTHAPGDYTITVTTRDQLYSSCTIDACRAHHEDVHSFTITVVAVAPSNSVLPSMSGSLRDGDTLTANKGTWSGTAPITYAYQWTRCDSAGGACSSIPGATNTTYQLGAGDVGHTLRVVVTATNAAGSTAATSPATPTVAPLAPSNTTSPSISGTARDAETLSATAGQWSGTGPLSYAYQWRRCDSAGANCADIAGAVSSTYQLAAADVGKTVRVVVSATNAAGTSSATSAASAVIAAALPVNSVAASISGTARDAQTLSADKGTWSGTAPISYAYQWRRCDSTGANCADISGATDSTYRLSGDDVGATVRVVVAATNAGGSSGDTSPPSSLVAAAPPANTGAPSIAGDARDGQTLTADSGSWSGTSPLSYTYQWQRCNSAGDACSDIAGANTSTYELSGQDVDTTLRVAVTATNTVDSSVAISLATGAVSAAPPATVSGPTVSGVARDGDTLQASYGTWSGTGPMSYTFQWRRCDETGASCADIGGADAATYKLSASDIAKTVRVVVTASNGAGSNSATSPATGTVDAVAPSSDVAPDVWGPLQAGETLTASMGSWAGSEPLSVAYQWQTCDAQTGTCSDVVGATEATYELGPDDVGLRIRLVVTATNTAGSETAASEQTDPVVEASPPHATLRYNANDESYVAENSARDAFKRNDDGTWTDSSPDATRVRQVVTNAVMELGGQPAAYPADVSAGGHTGQQVADAIRGMPETQQSREINSALMRTLVAARLMPSSSELAARMGYASIQLFAGVTTFQYTVWTGTRKILVTAQVPEFKSDSSSFTAAMLVWHPELYKGEPWSRSEVIARNVWVYTTWGQMWTWQGFPVTREVSYGASTSACGVHAPPPEGFTVYVWETDSCQGDPGTVKLGHAYESDLPTLSARPFDPSRDTQPGLEINMAQPSTTSVEDAIAAALADEQNHDIANAIDQTIAEGDPTPGNADIDLDKLAAAFGSGQAVCDALVTYPYGTHRYSTVNDQWYFCELAVRSGLPVRQVIVAAAAAGVVSGTVYWYLVHEVETPTPTAPPDTGEDDQSPPPVPVPLPPVVQDEVDALANDLLQKNPDDLDPTTAEKVADQCIRLVSRTGVNARRRCARLPIFSSGADVKEATQHDLEALQDKPVWVKLNREYAGDKPGRGWTRGAKACQNRTASQDCDEYPFFGTQQGGRRASIPPSLKPVDSTDNRSQGGYYGAFITKCDMQTGTPQPGGNSVGGDEFLGIPTDPDQHVPTLLLCNGKR